MIGAGRGPVKKHITTACTCCRRRKVKCDGVSPTCSNCILYNQVCKYNYGDDRRKLSSKRQIEQLSQRVHFLEDLLRSKGIEVPPENEETSSSSPNDETAVENLAASSSRFNQVGQGQSTQSSDELHFNASNGMMPPLSMSSQSGYMDGNQTIEVDDGRNGDNQRTTAAWNAISVFQKGLPAQMLPPPNHSGDVAVLFDDENAGISQPGTFHVPAGLFPAPPGLRRQSSIEWHEDNAWASKTGTQDVPFAGSEPGDEMIDQLSARMGSFKIAEDGQLRYFGATSNLHILHNGASSMFRAPIRSVQRDGKLALQRAGLGQDVPAAFEQHLEKLYFAWEDPAIHVVDEEMYHREKARYEENEDTSTSFFSESLKNAICAIGANLSGKTCRELPEPIAEFFSSRAKALLDIEMDSPTVATVQALVIMSASEAAFTRDARGWIYSGMAVRISADLGLHLDLSGHVKDGRLTAQELDVRRTTFWGVFVHDNMWSLYVGRPWGINIRDISISRPSSDLDRTRNKSWKPYSGDSDFGSSPSSEKGCYDPIESCADANVSLCAMMRRLSRTLYAGRSVSSEDLEKFATEMRHEFSTWHATLSQDLAVDTSQDSKPYLPHVLQLHMQFHVMSIFLHRPFFSRNIGDRQVSIQAQQACTEAAQSTVKLLQIYRKQHTLRRTNVQIVHLLFTASLIHIYNTCRTNGRASERAMVDLQFCTQALGEIGIAYKNASRALEVVICVRLEWQRARNDLRLKRPRSSVDTNGDKAKILDPRKRRATGETQHADMGLVPSANDVSMILGLDQGQSDSWAYNLQPDQDMNLFGQWEDEYPMLNTFSQHTFASGLFNSVLPTSGTDGDVRQS